MNNNSLNQIIMAGAPVEEATVALVLIHGRGGKAEDIIGLLPELKLPGKFTVSAPQAPQQTWYPYSFMAPETQNQPELDQSLALIGVAVEQLTMAGFKSENIYFLGFSQGACLILEYVARNAKQYGGVCALTGGLIGEQLNSLNYTGNFSGTRILITTGVPDPHVPFSRIQESENVLTAMGASVSVKSFPGKSHGITLNEIELAKSWIFNLIN